VKSPVEAFPLAWPPGWRRTQSRKGAQFSTYGRELAVIDGLKRVISELERLGVTSRDDIVVSTNLRTRLDGLPRSDQAEPTDPGAAVYWQRGKKTECIAIDRYKRVADNLAAIAATLEAMRAIERHGGAEILDRAFTGFAALPAPEQPFQVLGIGANATRAEIDAAWRKLAAENHPDRPGGDADKMARINAARDALLEQRP